MDKKSVDHPSTHALVFVCTQQDVRAPLVGFPRGRRPNEINRDRDPIWANSIGAELTQSDSKIIKMHEALASFSSYKIVYFYFTLVSCFLCTRVIWTRQHGYFNEVLRWFCFSSPSHKSDMYVTRLFEVILEFKSTVSKYRFQFNGTWMFNENAFLYLPVDVFA